MALHLEIIAAFFLLLGLVVQDLLPAVSRERIVLAANEWNALIYQSNEVTVAESAVV
jgi:hypothetical protein